MPFRKLGDPLFSRGLPQRSLIGSPMVVPLSSSAPLVSQGWRAYWQAMDGASVYKDAGVTLAANGETCQQFNESLGVVAASNLSQAVAGNRPTFQTGGAGGKSRLFFDGLGDTMANAVTIDNYFSLAAFTIIMGLMVPVGFTTTGVVLRDASSWFDIRHMAGNTLDMRVWDTAYRTVQAAFTPGTALVVSFKHDGGILYSKVNNGTWVAGNACGNRGGSTALQLVGAGGGDVNMYAFALANVVLSDSVLSQNITYLMNQLAIP